MKEKVAVKFLIYYLFIFIRHSWWQAN